MQELDCVCYLQAWFGFSLFPLHVLGEQAVVM